MLRRLNQGNQLIQATRGRFTDGNAGNPNHCLGSAEVSPGTSPALYGMMGLPEIESGSVENGGVAHADNDGEAARLARARCLSCRKDTGPIMVIIITGALRIRSKNFGSRIAPPLMRCRTIALTVNSRRQLTLKDE